MAQEPHDGSDWSFRMMVEDRYKRLVILRRSIRRLNMVATAYVPLRTAWHCIPYLLDGEPMTRLTQAILLLDVLMVLLYLFAFGFGKPHREKQWAVKVYGVVAFVLLAEVVLTFFQYHVLWPKSELYPGRLATRFRANALGLSAAAIKSAAQVFEAVLDVVGIVALIFGVLATKEYVLEKRDLKREAGEKKD